MKNTEILLKYTPYIGTEGVTYENILKAMNEIEQQTRDDMFEFVIWMDENACRSHGKNYTIFQDEIDIEDIHIYTLPELFSYWQLNIKEKP
jgi:hypothetical protein